MKCFETAAKVCLDAQAIHGGSHNDPVSVCTCSALDTTLTGGDAVSYNCCKYSRVDPHTASANGRPLGGKCEVRGISRLDQAFASLMFSCLKLATWLQHTTELQPECNAMLLSQVCTPLKHV